MATKKYASITAIAELWAKVKAIVPTKTSDLTNDSGFVTENTTYTISISNNRISLNPSSGTGTYVDLPVYDGSVTS